MREIILKWKCDCRPYVRGCCKLMMLNWKYNRLLNVRCLLFNYHIMWVLAAHIWVYLWIAPMSIKYFRFHLRLLNYSIENFPWAISNQLSLRKWHGHLQFHQRKFDLNPIFRIWKPFAIPFPSPNQLKQTSSPCQMQKQHEKN